MSVAVREFKQADLAVIKTLFTAYHDSLPVDITFQNYQDEFAQLPGNYSLSKRGALFVAEKEIISPSSVTTTTSAKANGNTPATTTSKVLGCVALRKMDEETCELKRLYVLPEARGLRVGFALVNAVIEEATRLKYSRILLDTLPTMTSALAVYEKAGFIRVPKYYETPIVETVFLEKKLQVDSGQSNRGL